MVEEAEGAEVTGHVDVHQVVADQVIHDAGEGVDRDVLQADRRGVLGAHQARFQHGEAGGHPHHEEAAHQERKGVEDRSEEHTSELQSLMRISYAVFCLKKKKKNMRQSNKTIATDNELSYKAQ